MARLTYLIVAVAAFPTSLAFHPAVISRESTQLHVESSDLSRRDWIAGVSAACSGALLANSNPKPAQAIGPVKINLINPTYTAIPCPKDKPIPGEKAMKGMKGLCVTVKVDLESFPEKTLDKAGVYGFVTDRATGESVLANNPDLSTDAGQFAMVPEVNPSDKTIEFEFIAAVPRELVRRYLCSFR
jgi:hypothetical protein